MATPAVHRRGLCRGACAAGLLLYTVLGADVRLTAAEPGDVLAVWSFAEGAGPRAVDRAGRAEIRLHQVGWVADGHEGSALRFSSPTARADVGAPVLGLSFTHEDSFTVELQLRTTRTGFCTLLMARKGGAVSYSLVMGREAGRISFELWSWSTVKLVSMTPVADDSWHHVRGSYDASTNLGALFVDGRLERVARMGHGGTRAADIRLGNNIGAHQPYEGDIDEFSISRGACEELQAVGRKRRQWEFLDTDIAPQVDRYLDRMFPGPKHSPESPADWQRTREHIRSRALWCLGLDPLPERPPLRPHVSAVLERDGYRLERIYWQTWPEVYASGWLYVPDALRGPAPAVLCPHGHWPDGARHPVVQSRCIGLAKLGYVVLAVDSVHAYDLEIGLSPLSVMTWHNMRGLDLLLSMAEVVDPTRIGCTGASGGGQQTMYLMAVDDRVRAAAPVVLISYWRRIVMSNKAHCACNHVPGMARYADEPELCAVLAPRPSLFVCVTGDWTREFPTEGFPDIQHVYGLYSRPQSTVYRRFESGHDYSRPMRELVYGFFEHWLGGSVDATPVPEPEVVPEALDTLRGMDGPPPDAKAVATVSADFRARRLFRRPECSDTGSWQERLRALRRDLGGLLGHDEHRASGEATRIVARGRWRDQRSNDPTQEARTEKVVVAGESGLPIPTVVLTPSAAPPWPACIVLHPEGKADALSAPAPWARTLLARGCAVVVPDLRFVGELRIDASAARQNGLLRGRPSPALAATDLQVLTRWLAQRPDIAAEAIGCLALPGTAVEGLVSAALVPDLRTLAVPDVGRTYLAGRSTPAIGHLLTVGDLPDIAAAFAPRLLFLGGASEEFDYVESAYDGLNARSRLALSDGLSRSDEAALWLAARLREVQGR